MDNTIYFERLNGELVPVKVLGYKEKVTGCHAPVVLRTYFAEVLKDSFGYKKGEKVESLSTHLVNKVSKKKGQIFQRVKQADLTSYGEIK